MPSAQFFHDSACYKSVLIPEVRYFAFAVLGIFFSEILNVFLLVKWEVIRCRTSYLTRAIVCTLASQFILSLIVNIGAFSGKTEDFRNLLILSASNYSVKMLIGIILIVIAHIMIIPKIKRREGTFFVDVGSRFTPFSIELNNPYIKPTEK